MNYISDLEEFNKLIRNNEEVIVYPDYYEGYITMEYLQYLDDPARPWRSDYVNRNICCVASNRDMTLVKHHPFNHNIPVLHISYLPHFRETAIMIIATSATEHEKIYNDFTNFGFKNIVIISEELIQQIKSEVDKFMVSGQALSWFIRYMTKKNLETQHIIAEQNEVKDINMKTFKEYKYAFHDKKVVIVGNGPTLKYYKPIPDAIHIGLNRAWLNEDIQLDYLFTGDNVRSEESNYKNTDGYSKIKHKLFIATHQHGTTLDLTTNPEDVFMMEKVGKFFSNGVGIEEPIFPDIRYHPLAGMYTIAFPALHFALFTYPKEIYLVGCDTTKIGHFYSESKNVDSNTYNAVNTRTVKVGYARMKLFADHHYPNTEIISINPVGLKGLFKDVYTDEYKKSLED